MLPFGASPVNVRIWPVPASRPLAAESPLSVAELTLSPVGATVDQGTQPAARGVLGQPQLPAI